MVFEKEDIQDEPDPRLKKIYPAVYLKHKKLIEMAKAHPYKPSLFVRGDRMCYYSKSIDILTFEEFPLIQF